MSSLFRRTNYTAYILLLPKIRKFISIACTTAHLPLVTANSRAMCCRPHDGALASGVSK